MRMPSRCCPCVSTGCPWEYTRGMNPLPAAPLSFFGLTEFKNLLGVKLLHYTESLWWQWAGFGCLLAVGRRHQFLIVVSPSGSSQWGSRPPQSKQKSERGQVRQMPESFCDLIPEETSHHFCHIWLVRSQSLCPTYRQRGLDLKSLWIPGGRFIGSHVQAAFQEPC